MIRIKRVYDGAGEHDGLRILVDRLWPRGLKKETARVDHWLKDVAPSDALRKWFGHDRARWSSFRKKFRKELLAKRPLLDQLRLWEKENGAVTLLFAARDGERNNAAVLLAELGKP